MTFNIQQIYDIVSELIVQCSDKTRTFTQISSIQEYDTNSLVFISTIEQAALLTKEPPAVVITSSTVLQAITNQLKQSGVVIVNNVRLAQAIIKSHFDDYDARDSEWPDIHPSAVIHPSATLGRGVRIGPNVVIGENVVIGNNSLIRSNSVIERNSVIGNDCIIHSLVNINQACYIGNRVILRPGVIIGNEGFGFAQDSDGHYHRIPHTGTVEINDDVQIGSNSNIDRGTYGKTIIQRGVKIDSLCHIAHNVNVGEDTLFVSQCGVAGSTTIGKKVILSGQTGVLDHLSIADDTVLVHRCGVTESIKSSGLWAGTPPKPFKEYVRNLNPAEKIKRLERKLNEKIAALEQKIATFDC